MRDNAFHREEKQLSGDGNGSGRPLRRPSGSSTQQMRPGCSETAIAELERALRDPSYRVSGLAALNDPSPIEMAPGILAYNERASICGMFRLLCELNEPNPSRGIDSEDGYYATSHDQVVMFRNRSFYKLALDEDGAYWLSEPNLANYLQGELSEDFVRLTDSQASALRLDRVTRPERKDAVRYTDLERNPLS